MPKRLALALDTDARCPATHDDVTETVDISFKEDSFFDSIESDKGKKLAHIFDCGSFRFQIRFHVENVDNLRYRVEMFPSLRGFALPPASLLLRAGDERGIPNGPVLTLEQILVEGVRIKFTMRRFDP